MTSSTVIPMADLHLHQEVSARLDRVLARREGRRPYDWDRWRSQLVRIPGGVDRLGRMSAARPVSKKTDTDDDLFIARVVDLLTEAAQDGAIFVEVRFGNETVLREGFMALFRRAEQQVRVEYPGLRAEAVATVVTSMPPDRLAAVAAGCVVATAEGLAGVDLLYKPYHEEIEWAPLYQLAERFAEAGLGITAHAGEFSPANIASAVRTPGLTRIGHGVFAATDPALMDLLVERRITLECCLTSNVVLGAVPTMDAHPLRRLCDHGVAVALGTDNPVRMGTTIGREYAAAATLGFAEADLSALTTQAIRAAFTTPSRRAELLRQLP